MNKQLDYMIEIFKALGDPTRLKIIRLVATGYEKLAVNEIAKKMGITNSAVSQHFKILKNVNLVIPEKKGYKTYYRANRELIESFSEKIDEFVKLAFIPCQFPGECKDCPNENSCDDDKKNGNTKGEKDEK